MPNYRDDVETLFSKTTGSFAATMVSRLDTLRSIDWAAQICPNWDTNQVKQMTKQVERWETRLLNTKSVSEIVLTLGLSLAS